MSPTELITSRLVFGLQPVREVIRAHGPAVRRVLVEAKGGPSLQAVERFANDHGIATSRVPSALLDKLAQGGRHQGVAADAPELSILDLDEVIIDPQLLAIALDEVQDPQNFGAVIRSAVALAGAAVVWPEHAAAPLSPVTFRASAGAIEHARLVRVKSLRGALARCREVGALVVALDASGDVTLRDVDLRGPTVIVVGAEGAGLRKSTRTAATVVAKVALGGPLASFNASVAAALGLYEASRQRVSKDHGTSNS